MMGEGVLLALLANSKLLLVVSVDREVGEVSVASDATHQVPDHEFMYPNNKTTSGMAPARGVPTWLSLGQSTSCS